MTAESDLDQAEGLADEIVQWQPGRNRIETRVGVAAGTAATGSALVGALALGALAMGAVAVGAVVIGALRIGRLNIRHARFGRIEVDDLLVRRLKVLDRK